MKKLINWCSLFWTSFFILLGLIFYHGHTTQINTEKDKFKIIETSIGSISGNFGVRSSIGLNNGFSQEGLRVFLYDASEVSGSRFREITDFKESEFEIYTDAGDRVYFGVNAEGLATKIWGIYSLPTVVKSSETLIAKYYSILADDFMPVEYVNLIGDCLDQNNKKIWEFTNKDYISINKNISADWAANNNILDKIPNTGDFRYWLVFENPVGGLATPARLSNAAYRGSGISQLDCNQQEILWGLAKIKISHKIPAINFWDGSIPTIANIPITATLSQSTHKLRSALSDTIKIPFSLPLGIDTSMPIEICLSYSANQAINTANIQLNIKLVNHLGGLIGVGQTSDRIITKNLNIASGGKVEHTVLIDDYDISNGLEGNVIFIQIKRTDGNGGEFYPIEICVDYYLYKMGKF